MSGDDAGLPEPATAAGGGAGHTDTGSGDGGDGLQVARDMWATDSASRALGMQLLDLEPGRARVAMTIRPDMVNGHDIAHGGLVATLADSAFALACNSGGEVTVAAGFDVDFLAPGRLGDELVAEAVQRWRGGRSGIYDVTVRRGEDVVAEFRGRSRALRR